MMDVGMAVVRMHGGLFRFGSVKVEHLGFVMVDPDDRMSMFHSCVLGVKSL